MRMRAMVLVIIAVVMASPLAGVVLLNGPYGDMKNVDVSLSITSPGNNAVVSDTTTVSIDYNAGRYFDENQGTFIDDFVEYLDIYIDGAQKAHYTQADLPNAHAGTLNYDWDTTQYSDGSHTFEVKMKPANEDNVYTDSKTYRVDNTPPTSCDITSPSSGSFVSGTITVKATASDNIGIQRIDFYLDGVNKASDTTSPYTWDWNTTKSSDGWHSIYAIAYDYAGHSKQSSTISVRVDNTPPSVSITSPNNNDIVSGTITITATASDGGSGVNRIEYYNDSIDSNHLIGSSSDKSSDYQVSWDTTATSDGNHTIYAVAYDNQSNSATTTITVLVDNTAPYVKIELPSSGYVGGTVDIVVNASDISGITKVEFYVDDVLKFTDTSSPYVWSWDTTQYLDGNHVVKAVAYNGAGNSSYDAQTYSVDNTPPSVSPSSPSDDTYVSGTITIAGSSSDSGSGVKEMTIAISTIGQVASSSSATISYDWDTTAVADGDYTIWINATDKVGNKNSTTLVVHVDNSPPNSFDLLKPANGWATNTKTITFEWQPTTDAGAGLDHYILHVFNSSWSKDYTTTNNYTTITLDVNDGTYSWYVIAYDTLGNSRQSTSTYSFTIDTTAAQFTVSVSDAYFSPNGDGYNDTTTISAHTTDGSNVYWYVEIYNSGNTLVRTYKPSATAQSSFSWAWNGKDNNGATLPTGQYTIRVWADDGVGNNASQDAITNIDLAPPSDFHLLYVDNQGNDTVLNDSSPTFAWGASSDHESGMYGYVLHISQTPPTDYATSTYSYTILGETNTVFTIPDALSDGVWYWWVIAIDNVHNTRLVNESFWKFTVDTTPPNFSSASLFPYWYSPNSDGYHDVLYINATSDESVSWNMIIYYAANNTEATSYSKSSATTFNYIYTGDLKFGDGQYYAVIKITDTAGNTNSTTLYFVQDTVPMPVPAVYIPSSNEYLNTSGVEFRWENPVADNSTNAWWKDVLYIYDSNGTLINSSTFTIRGASYMDYLYSLPDGRYHFNIVRYDMAGNKVDTGAIYFAVDTAPPTRPVLLSPPNNNLTNAYSVNFTWQPSSDASPLTYTLHIYYASTGQEWQSFTTTDAWYVVDFSTINGQMTFKWNVSVVDGAGNSNRSLEAWSITIDHDAPQFSYTLSSHYVSPNGDGRLDTITVNTTSISNGGEPLKWEFIVENHTGDGQIPDVFYDFITDAYYVSYSWTWNGEASNGTILPDGNYTLLIIAYDRAGNSNLSGEWIIVDTVEPEAPTMTAPVDGALFNSSTVNITWVWGNVSDMAGATLYIYNSSGVYASLSVDMNIAYYNATYPDGHYYAYIELWDYAENHNVSGVIHFVVDTTPPFGSLHLNATYNTLNITLYLNGIDNTTSVDYFRYRVDGGNWSDWIPYAPTYTVDVRTAGTHTVDVQYKDTAGHSSPVYSASTVVSTAPPTVDFTVDNATANNTVGWENITLDINASSDTGLTKMRIVVKNESGAVIYDSGWIDYNDTYLVKITATGYYNITVYVEDRATNTANASHVVYVDLDAPLISGITVEHYLIFENSTTVSMDAADFSGIARYGYAINGTFVAWFNTSEFAITLPPFEGNYTITVYVVDSFGHVATANTWIYEIRHRPTGSVSVDSHLTNNATVNIHLSASDTVFSVVGVWVKVDNGAWQYYDYTPSITLSFTADGNHTIFVKFITDKGVNSTEYSTWIVVDTAPPTTVISHLPAYTNATALTIAVQGSDTLSGFAYYKVYIRYNGGAWAYLDTYLANQTTITIAFAQEGTYEIAIVGYDRAGNHEDIEAKATVVVDRSAPTLNVNQGDETLTDTFNLTLSWSAADNTGIAYYLIIVYKGNLSRATPWKVINTTETSVLLVFEDNATYIIEIRAYDLAGNFVEKSLTITENYNYAPVIKKVDIPQNISAGQEATFYAEAYDVKGDAINYTWMLGNDTIGYGQYLKYKFPKAGNYTIILVVSDGVHNITRTFNITVAPAHTGGHGETNAGTPDIFMDLLLPILLFVGLLVAVLLILIMIMKKRKKQPEEKEEGLSKEEVEVLNGIKGYLEAHNGEKIDTVLKAVAEKMGIDDGDVLLVLDYGVSKGIFTKETDADGNVRVFLTSQNIEIEGGNSDEGGKE